METKIVTIDLGERSYDIYIGGGLIYRLADFIGLALEKRDVFIVGDKNTAGYAKAAQTALRSAGAQSCHIHVLPAGEQSKSYEQLEKLTAWLLESGANRDSLVIAMGGGVVGDLAGFAASITMRGMAYMQVPTTLLAQVDSSVGGKTGINTAQGKNLVGAFYQPISVVADIETLKSLPRREILAGYAEIVKYALIGDPGFFDWLEDNGEAVCALEPEALSYAIEKSCQAKADIVAADEREAGRRALLNLGHTFGHALEAAAKYDGRLLHGEAVAIGTLMAFDLSSRMALCGRDEYERVEAHFLKIGLPVNPSFIEPRLKTTAQDLLAIMKKDKKVSAGQMRFVLAEGIGEALVSSEVEESLVLEVLQDSLGARASGGKTAREGFNIRGKRKGIKGLWQSAFSSQS